MGSPNRKWVSEKSLGHGIWSIRLKKVDYLVDCLEERFGLKLSDCIFRGQRKHNWSINSSFDRSTKFDTPEDRFAALAKHLDRFRRSVAGRRGANPIQYDEAGDWWALGQHYGLWTPLIDWSRSPWIGLFFALEQPKDLGGSRPVDRAVAALNWARLYSLGADDLNPGVSVEETASAIDFHECFPEDNPRLLSQSGLFSFSRKFDATERAIRYLIKKRYEGAPILVKIRVPDDQRMPGIRLLRSMNINHVTLFPDVSGAGLHSNALIGVPN
jgi:FRG domain